MNSIMNVMFYVTIILLGIIITSGTGYLLHYYIKNKDSPEGGEEKNYK